MTSGAILALFGTAVFVSVLKPVAQKASLVDRPCARKQHEGAVPLVGGIAIYLALVLVAPFLIDFKQDDYVLIALMCLLVTTGAIDDRYGLSARMRLVVQAFCGLAAALIGSTQLTGLGDLFGFGPVVLGMLAIPFTMFAVSGVINAMNMIDGVDGLAGGVALVAFAWLLTAALTIGELHEAVLVKILMFAIAGFLLFNLRTPWRGRAAVFLGDAGSTAIGFALAWFAIQLSQGEGYRLSPMAAVWILAVPIIDTLSLMVRRVRKGRSPFSADRDHLHHVLLAAGFTPAQTTALMVALCVACGAVGYGGWRLGVPDYTLFFGFVLVLAMHIHATSHAWRLMRLLRRLRGANMEDAHGTPW